MTEKPVDKLVEELESLANAPPQDADQRLRLKSAAQRLAWNLESPHDTICMV